MSNRQNTAYATLLLTSALLSLLAAAHHPEVRTHDLATALRLLADQSRLIAGVHAVLLLLIGAQLVGFYGFARLLGVDRVAVAAGLLFVGAGTAAMLAAAAINGFAVPALASDYRAFAPADAGAITVALRLCWQLNQAFAAIGAVAWGLGLLFWSVELGFRAGLTRIVGLGGGLAALAIAGGVGSGLIRLHVGGFIAVIALLTAWSVAAALLMLTRRLDRAPSSPSRSAP
ncbi:MAG: hypothetical protein QOJ94_144 [Sphingomonadales bacterium]|jgi:hypothetical protein|nr:hypothetical protein [Sphingomonadales bacterium]